MNTLVNFQSAQPSKNGQFSIGLNMVAFGSSDVTDIDSNFQVSELKKIMRAMFYGWRIVAACMLFVTVSKQAESVFLAKIGYFCLF